MEPEANRRGTCLRIAPPVVLAMTLVLAVVLPWVGHGVSNKAHPGPVPAYQQAGLRSALEDCRVAEGSAFVRGWAYVEGELGVRRIDVYLTSGEYSVRLPSRVGRREDVAVAVGRPVTHDALHDGVSAGSSRLSGTPPLAWTVTFIRKAADGRVLGAAHACT
ncbi:hypothetical protein E2F46_11360 [Luteimonas aestuarii]|uniref:Uncharacterized protein n=1 Tax=Luteimonas aestuarii TaxID=453837 RepID=A0A4R5TKW6_9GAMM|nr:hypothetical protein [Luteimonas aestuarii]TDK23210.1 hypothetical protein E2F46_11360 [Luteimonas aestuarii]